MFAEYTLAGAPMMKHIRQSGSELTELRHLASILLTLLASRTQTLTFRRSHTVLDTVQPYVALL